METPRKQISSSKEDSGSQNGDTSNIPSSGSIQVVLRLRPMNENEKKFGTLPVVTASTNDKSVTVIKDKNSRKARLTYSFDNVFTSFSTQEEVFNATLLPVLDDVFQGYESTVFAYGQTGTGKTYTMEGDLSNTDMHGVIPRSTMNIFDRLQNGTYEEYSVKCTYLEIYNEELSDLLSDDNGSTAAVDVTPSKRRSTKLEIMGGKSGPFCRGLSEKQVHSPEDVLRLMETAQQHRQIGETKMNKSSSRSHCIFTINVIAKSPTVDGTGTLQINGKLHLVDLAGSECAKTASGDAFSEPTRERERMNINRSLLTLGRVISLLREQSQSGNKKSVRIPYRDSKLTRILQESLGGRCKTVIIATLSPSVTSIEESISTLNYAQSANRIINKPVATSYLSMRKLSSTPSRLSSSHEDSDHPYQSIEDWNEMEIRLQYMQTQVEEAQSALARKHILQQEAEEKAEAAVEEKEKMEITVDEQRQEIESLKELLMAETLVREELSQELTNTKTELATQTSRAEKAEETCRKLTEELETAKSKIQFLEENLGREIELKRDALAKLRETSIDLKKTKAILAATQTTESLLTTEALALLNTLKESVSDGDSLYSSLEKHREETISIRADTREYSNQQNKILDEILQYLILLTQCATDLCKNLDDDAKSNYSQGVDMMDKTYELFQQMSNDLGQISMAIRSQSVGPDGVVPLITSTASDLSSGLDKASNIIMKGEEEMATSIIVLRERLIEHSSKIAKLWTIHDANANIAVSTLESDVESSKAKLMKMIESTNDKIKKITKEQDGIRQSQADLVSEWELSSMVHSQNIQGKANTGHDALVSSLDAFKSRACDIDDTDVVLETQEALLNESGNEHSAELINQHKVLQDLKNLQTNDQVTLESMRDSFMTNVMTGISSLINEQMNILKAESTRHFDAYKKKNDDLMAHNVELTNSATNILNQMTTTNMVLKDKSARIRENDQNAASAMHSAQKVLGDIHDISQLQRMTTKTMAQKVGQCTEKLSKLDKENTEMITNLGTEGSDLTDYLENSILNAGVEHINLLAVNGRDLAHYGENVLIPEFIASLEGIEAPRPQVIADFNTVTKGNKDRLEAGKDDIIKVSDEQCVKADEIRSYARDKEDYFDNSILKNQKKELDNQRDKLISYTKDYKQSTSTKISSCTEKTSNIKSSMEEFIVDTIKAREDVSSLDDRSKFIYEETLSSTPGDEIICEPLNFDLEMAIGVGA